jgi:hypothetical protein
MVITRNRGWEAVGFVGTAAHRITTLTRPAVNRTSEQNLLRKAYKDGTTGHGKRPGPWLENS